MSETQSLVSWDAFEDQGKIEGSDWICPTGSLKPLETVHMMVGEATDEDVLILADGRRQHLSLSESPEGYQAAKIIDSESGEELIDSASSYRYAGIIKCNCGQVHGSAVMSVLSDRSRYIPLQDGKMLAGVYNYSDGTQSVVKPTEDRQDPDYIERVRTGAHITTHSKKLFLYNEGAVDALPGGRAKIDIRENEGMPEMELILWLANGCDIAGQINLDFDASGALKDMKLYKTGLLDVLGINSDHAGFDFNQETGWGVAQTSKEEARVLASMAEALGLGEWTGFDLKMTASGLYKAMGKHNLDPTSVLAVN